MSDQEIQQEAVQEVHVPNPKRVEAMARAREAKKIKAALMDGLPKESDDLNTKVALIMLQTMQIRHAASLPKDFAEHVKAIADVIRKI